MRLQYRPEIDGLRALSVLAVVVFHAGFIFNGRAVLSGGFIGVDIFFVISGYLITSIILRALADGGFSLKNFYQRRARRILPALFTVMFASVPLAWALMLPKAMQDYAGANLSSLLFGSNFWFWQEDTYFGGSALLKPFLHTWSLSVEEQFYVLFPVLLMALWALARKHILAVFIAAALVSLVAAHMLSASAPDAAFYLLPFRGWELLAGAGLARLEQVRGRAAPSGAKSYLPLFGLALIFASFILFNAQTPHPSLITAYPIVGTMLIIWYGGGTDVLTRLLSSRLLVGIGLISYSLYLWHYMLFAFARIWQGEILSAGWAWAVIAASFALSVVTYFLIEKPARNGKALPLRWFVGLVGTAFLGLLVANIHVWRTNGAPQRMGAVASLIAETKRIPFKRGDEYCIAASVEDACYFPVDGARETLVLVGDSHAEAIGLQLQMRAQNNGVNFLYIGARGCPLIPGGYREDHRPDQQKACLKQAEDLQVFLAESEPVTIVYFSYMAHYLGHPAYVRRDGITVPELAASIRLETGSKTFREVSAAAANMFHDWINNGHKLVLIYPVPEAREDIPKAMAKIFIGQDQVRAADIENIDLSTPYTTHLGQTGRVRILYDIFKYRPNVKLFFPELVFCKDGEICRTHDARIYYADDNHLAPYGSKIMVDALAKTLGWTP